MRGNMKNKSRSVMERKLTGAVCVFAFFCAFTCFRGMTVYASENGGAAVPAAVVGTRTTDDAVYAYVRGVGSIASGTTVQIGNTLCEDVQVASVMSMGMPIKTTILFDNSQSLSKIWGSRAKELVAGLIDNHAENEEFKIATFAESLNVISDYTADYEALKSTVEGIEFLDQPSYLTDILYDFLNQERDSREANYTRLIIITDGADDNEIKYTQAELSDLMKGSGVVIHTVGVKNSKNSERLESLFSYARLTGGTYSTAEKNTDSEGIRSAIDEDYSLLCLRLVPRADIMDGGKREAKFTLNTPEGTVVLTASLQMPFADVSSMPPESVEQNREPVSEPEDKEELPSIDLRQPPKEQEPGTGKKGRIPVIAIAVGAAAAALLIVILLAVLLVLKGKKKKTVDVVIANNIRQEGGRQTDGRHFSGMQSGGGSRDTLNRAASAAQGAPAQRGSNTVRLGAQASPGSAGNTRLLQGGNNQNMARQSYIALSDIKTPQRSFRVPIDTRIVIGRESGDIVLGFDAAVSYTHCEILKKGNLFYVNDLKSSNGTFYGNMRVHQETPVMNGGILEIGAGKYKITIESQ